MWSYVCMCVCILSLCMCVCAWCVYACMYLYVPTHLCMYHLCTYAYMHLCICACMHVCMYECVYEWMYSMYERMHACLYGCMNVCMYVCMPVHRKPSGTVLAKLGWLIKLLVLWHMSSWGWGGWDGKKLRAVDALLDSASWDLAHALDISLGSASCDLAHTPRENICPYIAIARLKLKIAKIKRRNFMDFGSNKKTPHCDENAMKKHNGFHDLGFRSGRIIIINIYISHDIYMTIRVRNQAMATPASSLWWQNSPAFWCKNIDP